jgi:protein O-mannosyl-transferase
MLTEKQKNWLVACLIIIIGSVIYANSLDVPFLFDDADNIQNPNLRIEKLDYGEFKEALGGGTLKSRPVSNFSFALNYYFGGYKVQGYHLVNIFIHISAAIILFHLVRLTLSFSPNSAYRHKNSVALFTALLWLTHPLATQSVTYVVQRMNSMAAMFYLLALLLYVLGRREQLGYSGRATNNLTILWYFIACGISGALAMGSKEIAATLPIVIFLYEWFFIQDLSFAWLKKRAFWILGVFGLILVVLYIYTDGHILQRTLFSGSRRDFTTWERVLTQFRVVVHYIGLMAFPHPSRLVFDYNIPFSTSFFSPITTLFSFLFLGGLFSAAVALAKRERLISFCILWFFINLAIESSIIGLELVFEHRTYLPSMFIVLLFPALLYRFGRQFLLKAGLLAGLVCLFSVWTVERNQIWQDPETFWRDSISKHPGKARAYNNLGVALYNAGEYEEAGEKFIHASILLPWFPEAYSNLGMAYYRQNRIAEAEKYLQKAVSQRKHYVEANLNLAALYKDQGKYDAALELYRVLHTRFPDYSVLNKEMGQTLLRMGEAKQSLVYLEKAYKKLPKDISLLLDRGEAFMRSGRLDEAIASYREVVEAGDSYPAVHYNLGMLLNAKGQQEEALQHYKKAEMRQSTNVPVSYNLGNLYLRLGDLDEAELSYMKIIEESVVVADAYNNLGLVYIRKGELDKALLSFQAALRINPAHPMADGNMNTVRQQLETAVE